MTFIPDNLNVLNWPIQTPEAEALWASKHKCNQAKAIIAFSRDISNANDNMRRYGYTRAWRENAIANFGQFVHQPSCENVPITPLSTPWWECMSQGVPPDPTCNKWVPAFDGTPGQTIFIEDKLTETGMTKLTFHTVFSHHEYNSSVCLVSTEQNGQEVWLNYSHLMTRPSLQTGGRYQVHLDGVPWSEGFVLPPKYEGKRVMVEIVAPAGTTFDETFHFGGDVHGAMDSVSTYIDVVSIVKDGETITWGSACVEEEPGDDDIVGTSTAGIPVPPITFSEYLNGWKRIEEFK